VNDLNDSDPNSKASVAQRTEQNTVGQTADRTHDTKGPGSEPGYGANAGKGQDNANEAQEDNDRLRQKCCVSVEGGEDLCFPVTVKFGTRLSEGLNNLLMLATFPSALYCVVTAMRLLPAWSVQARSGEKYRIFDSRILAGILLVFVFLIAGSIMVWAADKAAGCSMR
jgi:hypothetical protein